MIKKLIFLFIFYLFMSVNFAMAEKNLFQITCGKIGCLLFLLKKEIMKLKILQMNTLRKTNANSMIEI